MTKRRIFAFLFTLCLLAGLASPAAAIEEMSVQAGAALLVEANTGEILYQQNAHKEMYPASITKVMTALLICEAIDAGTLREDQVITASESAFSDMVSGGSSAGIKVGEELTVRQLLQCLLVVSANEAANILAEALCGEGNIAQFVEKMNARAAQLGCENTHYVNPHGLHDARHYTTAYDIYLIAAEAMRHDLFMEICTASSIEIPATNKSDVRALSSTNYLIVPWRTYYNPEVRGIKTGSTPEAGHCLVSSAVRGSRTLISVVLNTERVWLEEDGGYWFTYSFAETNRLFDWGFDSFEKTEVLSTDELICEVPVSLSSEASSVVVQPKESIERMMPIDLKPEEIERSVTLKENVEAPVARGDELGELTLLYNGEVIGSTALLAVNDVSASRLLVAKRDALAFLSQTWVKLAALGLVLLIVLILALTLSLRSRRYGRRRRGSSGYRGRRR